MYRIKSFLGFINYYILQWFTLRIWKKVENNKIIKIGLWYGIKPLTGWLNDYEFFKFSNCWLKDK